MHLGAVPACAWSSRNDLGNCPAFEGKREWDQPKSLTFPTGGSSLTIFRPSLSLKWFAE
jgi:hypothetical protein